MLGPSGKKEFEKWAFEETRRVERQRTLFAMLPDTRATDRLKQAMLDRAWVLLDAGECEACDALLEFIPEDEAQKLLDEFFNDDGG